jgi:hypothetical protein
MLAAGLLLAAAGCRDEGPKPNLGALSDASYGDVPIRGVSNDLPDGLNFQGDGPDTSLSGNVGSTPVLGSDAGQDRTGRPPDGPADSAGPAGSSCNLVSQDCAGARGCYPAGGAGTCRPAGVLTENMPCGDHQDCEPGLLCAEVLGGAGQLCEPICDSTAVRPCPDNRPCQPFAGSLVGTCAP